MNDSTDTAYYFFYKIKNEQHLRSIISFLLLSGYNFPLQLDFDDILYVYKTRIEDNIHNQQIFVYEQAKSIHLTYGLMAKHADERFI